MSFGAPTAGARDNSAWWAAVRAGDHVALARQLKVTADKRARLESRAPARQQAGPRVPSGRRAEEGLLTAVQWLSVYGTGKQHARCLSWLLSVGAAPDLQQASAAQTGRTAVQMPLDSGNPPAAVSPEAIRRHTTRHPTPPCVVALLRIV